ncbi:MAG: HEPN domain-containing protein [Dehalococcoidales bacterium]|nr:HEPN domain-containing protein [Dehalococcoidales bacterium]
MKTSENSKKNSGASKEQLLAQLKPVIIDALKKAFPDNREVTDNFAPIFDLLAKKALFEPDDETRDLGISFLNEASRDVKSCKVLNSKKIYPHAVYHLQQAVEKSAKGYVLLEGYFDVAELNEIATHRSPSVMMKAMFIKTGIKSLISKDPVIKNKMETFEAAITNEGKRIDIAKIPQIDIRIFCSQIEEYRKMGDQLETFFTSRLTGIDFDPNMATSLSKRFSAIGTLFLLAIITFPHEAYTRYPALAAKMSPDNYDRRLGIICEIPRIVRLLEKEIRNLQKIYE